MSNIEEIRFDALNDYFNTIRDRLETLSEELMVLTFVMKAFEGDKEFIKEVEQFAVEMKELSENLYV